MGGAHTQSRMAVISFLKSTPSRHAATLGLPCTPGPFSRELVSWFPPSLAEAQVSSLGATLGTGRQGWVPKAERSNLPEELVFPEVKESQRVRSQPVGYRGRKTPTPRSTPQAPTLLYLFTLEKAPRPRQEMGQFQQAELGEQGATLCSLPDFPTLGQPQEPRDRRQHGGPGRKEAWTQAASVQSQPCERASVWGRMEGC